MSKEQELRKAYIEGDEAVLPILGDWYEDQDDPMHLVIRDWCKLQREVMEVLPLLPAFERESIPSGTIYSNRIQLLPLLLLRHIPLFWKEFPEQTIFALMRDEPLYGEVLRVHELRYLDGRCGRERDLGEAAPFRELSVPGREKQLRDYELKIPLSGKQLRQKIQAEAMAAAGAILVGDVHHVEQFLTVHANTNPYPVLLGDRERQARILAVVGWVAQLNLFLAHNEYMPRRGPHGTSQEG